MSMTDETVIDKITKLLAKAESTTHTAEAEAFTAKATELMMKWAIDEAMINAAQGKPVKDEIVRYDQGFGGTYWKAHSELFTSLGYGLGFRQFHIKPWSSGKGQDHLTCVWIGFRSEIEAGKLLFASLLLQATSAQAEYMKNEFRVDTWDNASAGMQKFKARRNFTMGFGYAVRDRLKAQRKAAAAAAQTEHTGASVALVLADRDHELDDYMGQFKLYKGRGSRITGGGMGAGRSAGQRADLGNPSVGGNRKAVGR
jgi:hypothetical protein